MKGVPYPGNRASQSKQVRHCLGSEIGGVGRGGEVVGARERLKWKN